MKRLTMLIAVFVPGGRRSRIGWGKSLPQTVPEAGRARLGMKEKEIE